MLNESEEYDASEDYEEENDTNSLYEEEEKEYYRNVLNPQISSLNRR